MDPKNHTLLTVLLSVLIGGGFYVYGKHVEKQPVAPMPGTITVSGEGEVTVAPDIAELSFGVTTGPQTTAKAATDKLSKDMNAIMAAITALGIAEKDIKTESFYLNPSYDWADGRQRLRGYEATQSLRVKVRDLDKVGDVLTAATNAGANQAGGVNFTMDDPEGKRDEARTEAIANAKKKAEALADQLGQTLGDVQSFQENGGGYYPPMPYMVKEAYGVGGGAADQASVPLPSGEQDITVTVTITYELK